MNHPLFAALGAIAGSGTMTLTAQTPAPSPPRPQTPSPSSTPSRTDDKTITVTGCLKAGDGSMDSSRTTPNPSASATSTFVLTDIDDSSSNTAGSGTTAERTPGRSGTSMAGKQYALKADTAVNLSAHVGHKVRVTGKLDDMGDRMRETATADPAARPADPARPGSTGARDAMGPTQTLTVSTVTMISPACTATR